MRKSSRSALPRQGVSLAIVVIVLVLMPILPESAQAIVLLGALTFHAWRAGAGRGVVVAAIASLVFRFFFVDPRYSLTMGGPDGEFDVLLERCSILSLLLGVPYLVGRYGEMRREMADVWRRVEKWNRLLLENAHEGVWVVDTTGRTSYVNDRMAEMLGYSSREMQGHNILESAIETSRVEALLNPKRERFNVPERQELRFRRGDGSKLWALVTTSPIPSENQESDGLLVLVEDITERRRAEQERDAALKALRASEARHGRLVESNIIGIITAGLDGLITEANDAFLRMVGLTRADLEAGRVRWTELTPPGYEGLDQRAIGELWASGACTPYEKEFFGPDGTRVPVLLGAAALERYPRQWIGFVLDLTRRKQAETALKAAKEAAEAASHAKDQFLAVLSHELRNPLTPVLTMATAMLDDPATPDSFRPMLEMTRRNIELEARLIDDLLDITRIARGKLQLYREVVDAHKLLDQVLEMCLDDIRAGGLRLVLDLEAESHHVNADPARIQQVFWNLIKNAVKFTPSGGVLTIRSRNESDVATEGRPRLVLTFSDTGIGIGPDALPVIFDAFEQGEASRTRQFGGLGLGLAISRAVVEAHGGHLRADSAGKGQGATFTLELATSPAPLIREQERPPAENTELPCRPLKILLVEDNQDTLRSMAWILSRQGHTIRSADSMTSALETVEEGGFNLVISDIELPDGSGLELMRSVSEHHGIPGIALSGFGSEEDVELSRSSGFAEHLTKPVDFRRLESAIRRLAPDVDLDPVSRH